MIDLSASGTTTSAVVPVLCDLSNNSSSFRIRETNSFHTRIHCTSEFHIVTIESRENDLPVPWTLT